MYDVPFPESDTVGITCLQYNTHTTIHVPFHFSSYLISTSQTSSSSSSSSPHSICISSTSLVTYGIIYLIKSRRPNIRELFDICQPRAIIVRPAWRTTIVCAHYFLYIMDFDNFVSKVLFKQETRMSFPNNVNKKKPNQLYIPNIPQKHT